jgi:hypothetical protein
MGRLTLSMEVFAWGPKDNQQIEKYCLIVEAVLRPTEFTQGKLLL